MIDLRDADSPEAGGKAAPLARLMRAGFNVPPGFVVLPDADPGQARHIDGYVAVRSSSAAEDSETRSAAGQYDTFLGVKGTEVVRAIRRCRASSSMAVIVQQLIDARISGVMFTGEATVIEASWGLGEPLVSGQITPDSWTVTDEGIVSRTLGSKASRSDRVGDRVLAREVPSAERQRFCLDDEQVMELTALGEAISTELGGPRDIEWAIADGVIWVLQARPVTTAVPGDFSSDVMSVDETPLATGAAASAGTAVGPVRIVRGPSDFSKVRPGDVLVCRGTDPAWTPLFTIASAVVTETGGVLSHAAIIAREVGIPAVLAVPQATQILSTGDSIRVDGSSGHIYSST